MNGIVQAVVGDGTARRRRRSALACAAVSTLSGLAVILWFRPGILHSDSLNQLLQGRTGNYNDLHPVLMSWLLGTFDRIVPGPLLALIFQVSLWSAGLGILTHLGFRRPAASLLIAAVTFWPPILVHLAVVQKDTQMAAALLFATATVALSSRPDASRMPLVAAFLALFYAQGCRHNAFPAVFPLLFLCVNLALGRTRASMARAALLTLVVAGLWAGGTALLTRHLTHGRSLHPTQELFLSDLAAMSVREGVDLFPAYVQADRPDVDLDWIRSHYLPDSINDVIFGRGAISWDGTRAQRDALRSSWWRAVLAHPWIYASVRLSVFGHLLGFWPRLWFPVFPHSDAQAASLHFDAGDSRYRAFMTWVADRAANGLWFRNWFYCLGLALGAVPVIIKRDPLGICVQLSAWLYLAAYLAVSPGNADFRYAWWVIVAALVMPALAARSWTMRHSNEAITSHHRYRKSHPDPISG